MRSIRRNGRRWHDRGAAAVEMALVLPLMLLMVGGIVDFGRYFFYEIQLTNAVREGARVASLGMNDVDSTTRVVTAAPVIDPTNVTIGSCAVSSVTGEIEVVVTAKAPGFQWFVLGPAMEMFDGEMTLEPEAKAVMRCEG